MGQFGVVCAALLLELVQGAWYADFARQSPALRPALEVRYANIERSQFIVAAETYQIDGDLSTGKLALTPVNGSPIEFALDIVDGATTYRTVHSPLGNDSRGRINLYRRGPYFCEVHWLDFNAFARGGRQAPVRGDLALFCYPEKVLASITYHGIEGSERFAPRITKILSDEKQPHRFEAFAPGLTQTISFPLFGETPPLDPARLETLSAATPLEYDPVRGCYLIGSDGSGGFQERFYHAPNRYDSVRFTLTNDDQPQTIYICQRNTGGSGGSVEGGVLLDEDGHPLPILVQTSKNFAGEKEEPFFHPADTAFSETWFPLHLVPNESRTVSSLHLYQNWGRHMVKQFSSLGAWMDYWHSSTGVTETTCYVPFQFDGNLRPPRPFDADDGGVRAIAIADLRAMSQSTFWGGQPQHDNVAGHSFLTYRTAPDAPWQYLWFQGADYRSTGPNWMDIGLEYLSSDGAIRATVDTWEAPQPDELRNFVRIRYEALAALNIEDPRRDFRGLTIASWTQNLRYTHFASSGREDEPIDFTQAPYPVERAALPSENAFLALYGDPKGSNAFILRRWQATASGRTIAPGASLWCDTDGATRLSLTPDTESLYLQPGDTIEIEGYWFPYGQPDSAEPPRRETEYYGARGPRIASVARGTAVQDCPPRIRVDGGVAEFTMVGGRGLLPVIVTGLDDYRWPVIVRKESRTGRELSMARNSDRDGVQVFVDDEGQFGAVFLIETCAMPQTLLATSGEPPKRIPKISLSIDSSANNRQDVSIRAPWMKAPLTLRLPDSVRTSDGQNMFDGAPIDRWRSSEGGALWFESKTADGTIGARISPNEYDVDLEFWFGNSNGSTKPAAFEACAYLENTVFEDSESARTWVHDGVRWTLRKPTDPATVPTTGLTAVVSPDGRYVLGVAWQHPGTTVLDPRESSLCSTTTLAECPPGRRAHLRGKLYLLEGTLEDFFAQCTRDFPGSREDSTR